MADYWSEERDQAIARKRQQIEELERRKLAQLELPGNYARDKLLSNLVDQITRAQNDLVRLADKSAAPSVTDRGEFGWSDDFTASTLPDPY